MNDQRSATEQIESMKKLALDAGLYDAVDWLNRVEDNKRRSIEAARHEMKHGYIERLNILEQEIKNEKSLYMENEKEWQAVLKLKGDEICELKETLFGEQVLSRERWRDAQKHKAEISSLKSLLGKERDEFGKREVELMERSYILKSQIAELVEALEKTLAALVSYKRYVPEPYKQNPIYIIGSAEAEQLAKDLIEKHTKPSGSSGAGKEVYGDSQLCEKCLGVGGKGHKASCREKAGKEGENE